MEVSRLIAYDISHNKKRNRLAKHLEKKGKRIQKSVFIVTMNKYAFKNLLKEIYEIVGKEEEVAVFTLCKGCENKALRLGPEWPKFYS